MLKGLGHLLWETLKGFKRDDCHNLAAVISFYAIFSMLPLAMITVGVLVYFIGESGNLLVLFQDFLQSLVPTAVDGLMQVIQSAIEKKQRVSLLSAGALLVIASFLVQALEVSLDRVFRAERSRNFFHSYLFSIGFVFVFIFLFCVPGLLGLARSVVEALDLKMTLPLLSMSHDVFFYFVAFMAFIFSVILVPNHKVFFRYAIFGAIAFTILTGLARYFFRLYIAMNWSRYDLIYGSLSVLIVVVIWIYYLSNIYLICAELVARLQERMLAKER